jgi:uncharacterized protein YyaL (SSP411 family)
MYQDGRLMRSWQGGRARHLAVAADHAWLVEACVRLSELTGQEQWRIRARRAAHDLLSLFWDEEDGGFFTTGSDAEALVVRPKEFVDGALPATNSIAVWALLRCDGLADDPALGQAVDRTVALALPLLTQHPGALADMVAALPMVAGRQEIVITGDRADLLAEVVTQWLPASVAAWGEPGSSPLFTDRPDGFAYVCRGATCDVPADGVELLRRQLGALRR